MKELHYFISIIAIACISACSAGFGFLGEDEQSETNNVIELPSDDANPDDDVIRNQFRVDDLIAPIDYLFVLDNSTSMDAIISRVRNGLLDAANRNLFPEDARIAVMSTMHGSPENNFSTTGIGINRYEGIDLEPGFLDFVEAAAVSNYRNQVPEFAARWASDACNEKWFLPNAQNSQGVPCLVAAMQTTGARVGSEAGALAVKHLLEKNVGQALFRNNAMVNVIFVSDTHDPGRPEPVLVQATPDFATLNQLLRLDNVISRLKFHALAPDQICTTEEVFDHTYYKLADASGGVKQDPCVSEDYSGFISSMIDSSKELTPVFRLEPPAASILGIRLDGRLFNSYQLSENGAQLAIDLSNEGAIEMIEVIYKKQ
ncbi:MAG: hypothetical protein ACOH5I_14250 [Oligoflexus sp.]